MKRGSITLPIILIMISFLTFSVIILNYSRVHSASLKVSILSEMLADSLLSKYDEYLYKEYGIMGIHPDVDSEESLIQMANRSLVPEESNFDFYGFKNIEVHSEKKSGFLNIDSFKISILNSNRTLFMVEHLEKAAKLFHFWKTFMEGKSLSDLYTRAIELMGELQKKYDECKKSYGEINKRFDRLREYANSVSSTQLVLLAYRLSQIKSSEEDSKEKDEIEEALLNFKEMDAKTAKLLKQSLDLQEELEKKIPKLSDIKKNLQEKKQALKDDEFAESANKMIEDIIKFEQSLKTAKSDLDNMIPNINEALDKFQYLSADISRARSGKEVEHREFDIKEEVETFKPEIDVFEGKSEDKIDVMKVAKFFWKVMKGGLFTNYLRFDSDISDDCYQNLPAVKFWRRGKSHEKYVDAHKNLDSEDLSNSEMSNESLQEFSRSTEFDDREFQRLSVSETAENVIDKFTIIDFALRHFNYNVYEKEGKSIKSLSKNPLYQSEVEYLIHGNKKPKLNMLFVDLQIWGMRNIANTITLLIHKREEIKSIAISLSSVTFGVGYPVAFGLTLFGWSSLESLADVRLLHEGNKLPVFKSKQDLLIEINAKNIDSLIKSIEEKGIEGAYHWSEHRENQLSSSDEKGKYGILFDYRDYLFVLMTFTEENLLLYRIQDIIQIRGLLVDEEFDITSFITMYEVVVEADLPLIYSNLVKSKISSKRVLGY